MPYKTQRIALPEEMPAADKNSECISDHGTEDDAGHSEILRQND